MDQVGLTAACVIKLEGQRNWNLWKFQVTVLLKAHGVFEVVDGSKVKSEKDPDGWVKRDVKAQSILVTRLSESAMTHIITCETAAQMWSKLLSVYEQKSNTSIHLLQQRFFSFKYEEGTDISLFLSKVQEMKCQLKQAGEDISERFIITKVLMSLPTSYSHFVSAWESVDLDKQKYDDLVARLLVEEERVKSKNAENNISIALLTRNDNGKGGGGGPVRKCFKCGRSGHFIQECRSTEDTRKCFVCNETGHLKYQCPIRNSKQLNKSDHKTSYAFSAMTVDSVMLSSEGLLSRRWIIDSGASEHMTFQRDLFTSFTETSNRFVILGDGRRLSVSGIGEIVFKDNNKLCKVLFLPELKVNLFSVSSVTSKGYTVNLSCDGCLIKKDGVLCATGYKESNFYVLDFEKRDFDYAMVALSERPCYENLGCEAKHEKIDVKRDIVLVKGESGRSQIHTSMGDVEGVVYPVLANQKAQRELETNEVGVQQGVNFLCHFDGPKAIKKMVSGEHSKKSEYAMETDLKSLNEKKGEILARRKAFTQREVFIPETKEIMDTKRVHRVEYNSEDKPKCKAKRSKKKRKKKTVY